VLERIVLVARALAMACRGHHELVLENLALRQQLHALTRTVRHPQLRKRDRLFWIVLAETWRNWRTALVFVRPDTVVRWPREWLRRRWTRRSARLRAGRPGTDAAIRTLVSQMAAANPLWGAPRIHAELGRVGVEVSERTVSRLLRRRRRPPSQTWRTFLTNHVATLASIDFFTVRTFSGRVLFVLVVLMHHRRRIVHINVTEHPTAAWTAQQMIEAFPDTAPQWLLRDRDAIYGDAFRRRVAGMGIAEVISRPSSPWQNPYAERVIGSHSAGVSRPCDRARGATPATNLGRLSDLLSRCSYASLPREGRAHATTGAVDHRRRRDRLSGSRRLTPPLRTTRSLTCAGVRMRAEDV
jgi:putative transposase